MPQNAMWYVSLGIYIVCLTGSRLTIRLDGVVSGPFEVDAYGGLRKRPDSRLLEARLFYSLEQTADELVVGLYDSTTNVGAAPRRLRPGSPIPVRLWDLCDIENSNGRTLLDRGYKSGLIQKTGILLPNYQGPE